MIDQPDFSKDLSDIFARHKVKTVIGEELKEAIREAIQPHKEVELYNIHKRSLPVGLDKVVAIGFTLAEAEEFIANRLKTKTVENKHDEKSHVIYYDIVRQDGHMGGVFDNDLPSLTKEIEEKVNNTDYTDPKWRD